MQAGHLSKSASKAPGIPEHVAIIMDGNGRWARHRGLPRTEGHRRGIEPARMVVRYCAEQGVKILTLFAFSSENWKRPQAEVGTLMDLFIRSMSKEVPELIEKGIRLRFIGERQAFSARLQKAMAKAEADTAHNQRLDLIVAVGYGGRWDITQAALGLAEDIAAGRVDAASVTPEHLHGHISTAAVPDPDLLIRTGGEQRISNFLLWQMAYTELYFSPVLWPDMQTSDMDKAFEFFASRTRRFGHIDEQLVRQERA